MATLKKNQLNQVLFLMVDKTDFATVESGMSADDCKVRYWGVAQNGSAATSGASLAAGNTSLVRSGLFRLKIPAASSSKFDQMCFRVSSLSTVSCADQYMVFDFVDNDDSDIMSRLVLIASDASDAHSAAAQANSRIALTQSLASDTHSLVTKAQSNALQGASRALLLISNLSDLDSAVTSRFSDIQSLMTTTGVGLNASTMSDLRSAITLAANASQLLLVKSMVSDINSGVTVLESRVAGAVATASDIVSQVWTHATASDLNSKIGKLASRITKEAANASALSHVSSRVLLCQSAASDAASGVTKLQSRITKAVATASMLSDTRSILVQANSRVLLTESLASDTHSLVTKAQSNALQGASRALLLISSLSDVDSAITSRFSDIQSLLTTTGIGLNASTMSDLRSAVAAGPTGATASAIWGYTTRKLTSNISLNASDLSDLRSAIAAGPAATITAADKQGIASRVWSNAYGTEVDSTVNQLQSRVNKVVASKSALSGVRSALLKVQSDASDAASGVTVLESRITAVVPTKTNIASTVWAHSASSDLQSKVGKLTSRVTKAGATASQLLVVQSMASDAHSAAAQANSRTLVLESSLSDLDSALTSRFSDIQSLMTTTGIGLNASTMSDLRSAITAGPTATVTASDISDIASAVWANAIGSDVNSKIGKLASRITKEVANASQLLLTKSLASDAHSAAAQANSRILLNISTLSDIDSAMTSRFSNLESLLTTTGVQLNASTLSDLRSAVSAGPTTYASDVSDLNSALSDIGSKLANMPTYPGAQVFRKNAALNNFEFMMFDSTDHITPKTGLTVTAQRSIDGGAFQDCANACAEISNGVYKSSIAAADLNGTVISLKFSAENADDTIVTVITQS